MSGIAVGLFFGATVVLALLPAPACAATTPPPGTSRLPTRAVPSVTVTDKMVRYAYTRYVLSFVGIAVNGLVLWWFLRSGASARLRDLAESRSRNGLVRACIYYPLFALAYALFTLPLAFYSGFLLPHQYGLSTNTVPAWIADRAKGIAISAALTSPLVALGFWLIRRNPRHWWVTFWLASIPLTVVSVYLTPLVFDPIFNEYVPLKNAHLRDRLLALAARSGIERGRVYQMDASRRTKAINGYVTGVGGSARIVLWDTLLQKMDEDEIAFVMAHEMGHYAENHVPIGVGAAILGSLLLLLIVDRSARWILVRQGERWQLRGLDDLAAVPLLLLILAALNFVGSPVESGISRTMERRADAFGLRMTGDGYVAARAFVKLSEGNLSLPKPPSFIQFMWGTHPSLQERIDTALAYERAHPRPLPVPSEKERPLQ